MAKTGVTWNMFMGTIYAIEKGRKMAEDIAQKVITLVAEQFSVDESEIASDTSFAQDLDADSLDAVELIMAVEDKFGISIPDEAAERIRTVGDLINHLEGDGPGAAGVTAKLPPRKPPPPASSPSPPE
jgi:acyl carrier protein